MSISPRQWYTNSKLMDPLTLSRIQFGDTAAFHIVWPVMSIGLALYMCIMEALWIYTKKESYYRQLRFWTKIFVLTFAIGTASGLPLAFQFGTNWSQFAKAAGDFLGNILGFETTVAFALESAFLAILIFGWKRVHPLVHFFSTAMVLLGASLSAFWIMVANSWMQVPDGVVMQGGAFVVTQYARAIFNPDALVSFVHMMGACVESTLFLIGGIAAWQLLRSRNDAAHEFFTNTLRYAVALALVVAPLQIVVGDMSGLLVARYQPEKLAATELTWNTNPPGQGAAWNLLAWPNAAGTGNAFEVSVPGALSLITTHSRTGTVEGLDDFPPDARPTPREATAVFYSFRLMVLIGFYLAALVCASLWLWYRGELRAERIMRHRVWLRLWVWAMPLGFIATEAGWMVREIGRQPWLVYHLVRTANGLSVGLNSPEVFSTTALITLAYIVFIATFIYLVGRIVKNGPDLTSPLP
jgi:cytochrome d ubiquinol oxidase subunit I